MKKYRKHIMLLVLFLSATFYFVNPVTGNPQLNPNQPQTLYYGIEINRVLGGYNLVSLSPTTYKDQPSILLEERINLKLSAMGSQFDTEIKMVYQINPETGQFTYLKTDISQGSQKLDSEFHIGADTARMTSSLSPDTKLIPLPATTVLENSQFYPHLIRDFVTSEQVAKTYKILDVRDGEVQSVTYSVTGMDTLELAGKTCQAISFDRVNLKNGLKTKMWIDPESGYVLKSVLPNNRVIFLSDSSIVQQVQVAQLDENIFLKANKSIADIQAISYMKVKAQIEPIGVWLTPEALNIPGQKFTGTVDNNLVDGIFEIEHPHYDGANAPAFPPDFSANEKLKKYLERNDFIEADDPVLVEKAQEITAGARDSWEAVGQISRWVSKNIQYAIPGGTTARNTYDIRRGECGAHSLLTAAFCRAVGIPARIVWGCMYVPNLGGAFGQHAWNEVYLGDAGWIPIDATAKEYDYLDSGHIRMAELESRTISFNPKHIEILDYRVEAGLVDSVGQYQEFVGNYLSPSGRDTFKVAVQNQILTVDIPKKMVLPFHAPDENGCWYCKLSNNLFLTFIQNTAREAEQMVLHEIVPLQKQAELDSIDTNIPEKFKPYLGKYLMAMRRAEFTVFFKDSSLAIDDPLNKKIIHLQLPDEAGRWKDEFNKNTIFFATGENGVVTAMNIEVANSFKRLDKHINLKK